MTVSLRREGYLLEPRTKKPDNFLIVKAARYKCEENMINIADKIYNISFPNSVSSE